MKKFLLVAIIYPLFMHDLDSWERWVVFCGHHHKVEISWSVIA